MFLCCKLSYNLVQSPCYDQVLTGIFPYGSGGEDEMTYDIRRGIRPTRPTDPSQNKWLQDAVWDVITTCWSTQPEERYELSIVYHVFSKYGQREAQRRGFLPRIASLFQFLRESEPEIERSIGEMDKAGFSAFLLFPSQGSYKP